MTISITATTTPMIPYTHAGTLSVGDDVGDDVTLVRMIAASLQFPTKLNLFLARI